MARGKRLASPERDLAFCNELHINNFICLLPAEKKRKAGQAKSKPLFSLQRTAKSPVQTDHRGYDCRSTQPIHSGKIASELLGQTTKSSLKQRTSEGGFLLHSLGALGVDGGVQ